MVIVLADHSMDWSRPTSVISLAGALDADPLLAGKVADRRQRRRRPPLLDRPRPASAPRRSPGCAQIARGHARRARRPRPRTPDVAAARPRGRRRRGLLQGGLAVQRPGPGHRQPDPRQPRPPGHPADPVLHRPAATRACRAAQGVARGRRAPSTSRRRWRRSSGSAQPEGGYDGRNRSASAAERSGGVARRFGERRSGFRAADHPGLRSPTPSSSGRRSSGRHASAPRAVHEPHSWTWRTVSVPPPLGTTRATTPYGGVAHPHFVVAESWLSASADREPAAHR